MGLITRETKAKNPYTREEDEIIIATYNDESDPEKLPTVSDVQKALAKAGFKRSKASLTYRIGRKLSQVNSLDEINYRVVGGDSAEQSEGESAEPAAAEASEQPKKKSRKSKKAAEATATPDSQ